MNDTPDNPATIERITFNHAINEAARVLRAGEMVHEQTMKRYNEFAQTWLGIASVINDRDSL